MLLYSTNNPGDVVDLRTAVLNSLPKDNGLYMPCNLEPLDVAFFSEMKGYDFTTISYRVARHLIDRDVIDDESLLRIIDASLTFDVPLKLLSDSYGILELWHGPTLAFKDFGARFMAELFGYFNQDSSARTTVLVATSGDTGGAVASGFLNIDGVDVIILYPSGGVSFFQELQLTTLGSNITAIEVFGSFDDCQKLTKSAFLDSDLFSLYNFSSANSINIARLIPQMFYYFYAYKMALLKDKKLISFCVPSGNLGNLTAGLLAKRIGLPVIDFIAANNHNNTFLRFLNTGNFLPYETIKTISNAMDVGAPSNFARIMDLYCSTWSNVKKDVVGYGFSDEMTLLMMKGLYKKYGYVVDPHTAVGQLAMEKYLYESKKDVFGITLSTAHPSKFNDIVEKALGVDVEIPHRLKDLEGRSKNVVELSANYDDFKAYMVSRK